MCLLPPSGYLSRHRSVLSDSRRQGGKKRQQKWPGRASISLGWAGCRSLSSKSLTLQIGKEFIDENTKPSFLSEGWGHHAASEGQHGSRGVWPRTVTSESGSRDEQENPPAGPPRALPGAPSRVCAQLSTAGSDLEPLCQRSPESAGELRPARKKLALSIGYVFKFEIFKYYEAEI